MNDFDKPVVKAETESQILDALQGVKTMQQEIMSAAREGTGEAVDGSTQYAHLAERGL